MITRFIFRLLTLFSNSRHTIQPSRKYTYIVSTSRLHSAEAKEGGKIGFAPLKLRKREKENAKKLFRCKFLNSGSYGA